MDSILTQAAAPAVKQATQHVHETVLPLVPDPLAEGTSYGVDRRIDGTAGGTLVLAVSRERDGKENTVKRYPLAPFARASELGLFDAPEDEGTDEDEGTEDASAE